MICQFKRLIYPRSLPAGTASYMVALYTPCETILDSEGNVLSEIKAVGYCLPTANHIRYEFKGKWSKNARHGVQLEVETFREVISPTQEGVVAFLCSGQIKGIGLKTAVRKV